MLPQGLKLAQITVILFLSLACVASLEAEQSKIPLNRKATEQQKHQAQPSKHQHHNFHHHHHHHQHFKKFHRIAKKLSNAQNSPDNEVEVFKEIPDLQKSSTPRNSNSTKLTRLTARDYYNRALQRRLNARRQSEWDYHTYNVHTNTFVPQPRSFPSGKGDDNTADVEFIGSSSNTNTWPGYNYIPPLVPQTTQPPLVTRPPTTTYRNIYTIRFPMTSAPPLVPVYRGYPTTSSARPPSSIPTQTAAPLPNITETPLTTLPNSNVHTRNADEEDKKSHICTHVTIVSSPDNTNGVFTRPVYKNILQHCSPFDGTKICMKPRLVYEQHSRVCCKGWKSDVQHPTGCMTPICTVPCQNGGSCTAPNTCTCPEGFRGPFCEYDIDECKEQKPCDQKCVNKPGSYYCACRQGFILQPDQQSCKKIEKSDNDAFEARDLENDIEDDKLNLRIRKIERLLTNERVHVHDLQKDLVSSHNEINSLRENVTKLESRTKTLENTLSNWING